MLYKILHEIRRRCGVEIFGTVVDVARSVLKFVAGGPGEERRNNRTRGESGDALEECAFVHDDCARHKSGGCPPQRREDKSFLEGGVMGSLKSENAGMEGCWDETRCGRGV